MGSCSLSFTDCTISTCSAHVRPAAHLLQSLRLSRSSHEAPVRFATAQLASFYVSLQLSLPALATVWRLCLRPDFHFDAVDWLFCQKLHGIY